MAVPRWPQDESPRQVGLGELEPGGGLGLARQVGLKGVLGRKSALYTKRKDRVPTS
jgi:hypothetical protein